MATVRWQEFETKVKNWQRSSILKSWDLERTMHVMKASILRSAPHVFQKVFVLLFGEIDPKYVTPDVTEKCNQLRKQYSDDLQKRKQIKLDPVLAHEAIKLTNDRMGLVGVSFKPASLEQAADRLPKDTSSGAPMYITPKSEELPTVLELASEVLKGTVPLPPVKMFWPVSIAWRTQMRESGEKHRIIAVFPQFVSILEMLFALPVFEFYESKVGKTWYSYGSCWLENKEVWLEAQKFRNIIEIDYTSFDKLVPGELLFLFYLNLESFFDFKNKPFLRTIFHWIRDYHLGAVVLNSADKQVNLIDNKLNGVLSGSVFTSFADSWINCFILTYCALVLGKDPNAEFGRVQGDDVVLATNDNALSYLDDITRIVRDTFHMIIGDKSQIRHLGEPMFYMGFLMNDSFKLMSEDLMARKMTITGRFIPEDDLPNKMVIWSKFCSICSCASNGYAFWLKYKDKLLQLLNIEEPNYFHDLTEGPNKPFSLNRVVGNAEYYVQSAWRYS